MNLDPIDLTMLVNGYLTSPAAERSPRNSSLTTDDAEALQAVASLLSTLYTEGDEDHRYDHLVWAYDVALPLGGYLREWCGTARVGDVPQTTLENVAREALNEWGLL